MFSVNVSDLEPNKYRLSTNIIRSSTKVAKAGTLIDKQMIARLRSYFIDTVYVSENKIDVFNIEELIDNETYTEVQQALKDCTQIDKLNKACKELTNCIMSTSLMNAPVTRMTEKKSDTDRLIDHCIGTACYAGSIACIMGLDYIEVSKYVTAGLLHDIGKLAVPDQILFSPNRLTDSELQIMRQHPQQGYNILKTYTWVSEEIRISVLQHHENHDGTGYPHGISGDEITDIAKVLHIADVYDALVRQRAYKPGWQPKEAYDYMVEKSGTMFSPKYVGIFKNNIPIYEVGSLVRLSDDSLAVVLRNEPNNTLRPTVITLDGTTVDIKETNKYVNALVQV